MTERRLLNVLAGFSVLTGMVIVVLTVLVLIHLDDVPTARIEAAHDSCELIVGLVRSGETKETRNKVETYIANSVLHDCRVYANHIIFHPGTLTIITKGKPHAN